MAHIREMYRGQQLSEEATDLMLNSWRTKTNKSNDSLFGIAGVLNGVQILFLFP